MDAKTERWPAFNVERRPIEALKPYKGNARTHSDEQVAQIAASIREWGWTQPVLVDEKGGVIAGHGRLMAAQSLGVAEVPVIVARGWSKVQKQAYVLADNQLALNADWDRDLLKVELGALGEMGFDTSLLGFGDDFLADVMADRSAGLTDPDDAPAAPVNPATRLGDVWLLGRHRVLCGSSTKAEDVRTSLAGSKPRLMVTDPPYGVNYDPAWRQAAGVGSAGAAVGKVLNDDRADWREAWALFPGSVAYVWHGGLHAAEVQSSLEAVKFEIRAQIVWVKTRPALSRGHYHWQHEPALYGVKESEADDGWRFLEEHEASAYAVKKGATAEWAGGRKQSTVWFIEHLKSDTGHGTQKPVECMRRPIENNSRPGDAVYDPFVGSGTTIIAAEMTGRACNAIELNPAYVDVVVERWQAFTGGKATLEATGQTFEEVSSERYDPSKDSAASYDAAIAAKRERLQAAE